MFNNKMFEGAKTVWRLIGMAIGTIAGLAFAALGGFVMIAALRPDLLNTEVTFEGGGPGLFAIFGAVMVVLGCMVIGKMFGVKIRFRSKHEHEIRRKVKVDYANKRMSGMQNPANFFIIVGSVIAFVSLPCFLQAKGEDTTTGIVAGTAFLLIGGGFIAIAIISKIKSPDDFKERKSFMKNSRYAIKAVVTQVREMGGILIAESEQTGLEYEADHVFNDLSEYKGAEVWVYLDPDDQSEYGKYFVDLEGMINRPPP